MFSASHVFVRLKIPKNVELLRKIEALVSGKPYRKKKEPEDWKKAEGWKLVGKSYVSYGSDVLDLVKHARESKKK